VSGPVAPVALTLAIAAAIASAPLLGAEGRITPEDALRRYPPVETNAAALDLEKRAAVLGIDLVPKLVKDRPRPGADERAAFEKITNVMQTWLKTELARPTHDTSEPPHPLREFLAARVSSLGAVRAAILRGDPPTWAERIDRGSRSLRPHLLGILHLHELLVVDALIQTHDGLGREALEDLDASWRLREGYASSPFFDCRMIAMATVRFEAGALRRIDGVPATWRERLRSLTPAASILEGLRLGTIIDVVDLDTETFGIDGFLAETRRAITRLYWRKCYEEAIPLYLSRIEKLETSVPWCDADPEQGLSPIDVSWWNNPGAFLNAGSVVPSAARLALDIETTRKILELRESRDANGGRWPESLPGIEKSANCPGDRWIYQVGGDGSMSLTFSRKIDWGPLPGTILPMRYEERPSRARPAGRSRGRAS